MPLSASRAHDGLCAAIAGLLALGYFAVAWLATSGVRALSPDALEYGLVARNLLETGTFTADLVVVHPGLVDSIRHPPELHGLLQPFLTLPGFWLLGPGADAVRLPALLSAAALIFATFDLGRVQAGALAGLLAAACLALHRDFLVWTLMASDDVTWALLSTVSVRLFLTGCRERRPGLLVVAGTVAGLATLQKVTGVILPLTFAGVLLADRTLRGLISWRSALGLVAPVALSLAAYAARNVASRDMLGFAFTGIDWLTKAGEGAYFAHYDPAPRMTDVVLSLGPARVLSVTAQQLAHVGRALLDSPLLGVLGPVALLGLVRSRASRTFAVTSLIHVALLVGIVTFGYHVEARYLSSLLPLSAVAVGTAVTRAGSWLAARHRSPAPRFGIAVTAAAGLVLVACEAPNTALLVSAVARLGRSAEPCRDALAFVRFHTLPGDAVLTSNPWWVAWETRRPAVQAPTNGGDALALVARHYQTTWAVTGRPVAGAAPLEAALSDPHPAVRALTPERAFDGTVCDVYRLSGVTRPALPIGPLLTHR